MRHSILNYESILHPSYHELHQTDEYVKEFQHSFLLSNVDVIISITHSFTVSVSKKP